MNAIPPPAPPSPPPSQTSWVWVLGRLVLILGVLLLLGVGAYIITGKFNDTGPSITITVGVLFGLPFSLGAIAAYLFNPSGKGSRVFTWTTVSLLVLATLILGAIFLQEGIVCLLIVLPLWLISGWAGSLLVSGLHTKYRKNHKLNCSLLACLPFAVLYYGNILPQHTDIYTVQRAIIIDAPLETVWAQFGDLSDIKTSEGQWNITQNLLQVPRPRSAKIIGDTTGAIRYAAWGDHITFEEHIKTWEDGSHMRWDFVFPNDSVHKYTDEHISPDGHHLQILDGGYVLTSIGGKKTQLVLDTRYAASTPINFYSAWWGELILGDIQTNVLRVVKDRAEQ